uniref:Protein kinase domain-containing protein n=1 Tax=Brassica oleracea TaxID=3712 RepID=A0A3P6GJL8_BRAOL|nr:unnamed protein product [Brassica oleracea]
MSAHKYDDTPSIELILALEAELKLARSEIGKLQETIGLWIASLAQNKICERKMKSGNLIEVNLYTHQVKLCDFGSAKVKGEPNISYICSRYYRASELIFGVTEYTTAIDIWSAGCVLAELLLGQPLFPGESGVDQLVEIIKMEEIVHPFLDELRYPNTRLRNVVPLFNFKPQELLSKITPDHARKQCSFLGGLQLTFFFFFAKM